MAKETKAKAGAKDVLKWRKKKWVQIVAPALLRNTVLGESLVMTGEQLVGKTIESNLMVLTGDMKKQHINVKFVIDSIKDGKAQTKLVSYKISPATIKRNVRRKRDRIDCVFACKTTDDIELDVKVLLITKNNTVNSVLTVLRKKTIDIVTKYITTTPFDNIVIDTIDFKIQNELKRQLKSIYPLRTCEIKFLGVKKKK